MAKAYSRSMTNQELVVWLQKKGLSYKDSVILQDQDFTGESFLLLDKPTCKDLGIGLAGQLMLDKLLQQAASESELEDSSDLARGEEVLHFCTSHSSRDEEDGYDYGCQDPSATAACVFRNKIWRGRQVLKVFFMNTDVLESWGLSVDKIIEWAGTWHDQGGENIPCFIVTPRKGKADIRVDFKEDEACWSNIGMEADRVKSSEPTMVLNLKGYEPTFQRSLVIHEFGHALGLEHEHQRSDFWRVVEKHLDKDRMQSDPRLQETSIKRKPGFQRDWFESKKGTDQASKSDYDPDSIMHYWFDSDWLINPQYRRLRSIDDDSSLGSVEKKYIKGLHKRQRTQQLALNPSAKDIQQLQIVYGNPQ